MTEQADSRQVPGSSQDERASGDAKPRSRVDDLVDIVSVVLLGSATLLAAWSGYQASLWNGIQAGDYAQGSGQRLESAKATTQATAQALYDSQMFTQWLNATDTGNTNLANRYVMRFRPEYRAIFDAWLKLDPLNNPNAPPAPGLMPGVQLAASQAATQYEANANALIDAGQQANDYSDSYVLFTVIFGTVLFLVAIADRFRWRQARLAVVVIAVALVAYGVISLIQLPLG